MEQLYYLYSYGVQQRRYERPICIVSMSNAIKASLDYLADVEDWRVIDNSESVGKFTYDPMEIGLTYIEYVTREGEKEYNSCIYSLEEVDMKYIGGPNV